LERFIDNDVTERGVAELDESKVTASGQIGLRQYRRALKRKKAGKPDLNGHEWNEDE
jgi:hypothetical protein